MPTQAGVESTVRTEVAGTNPNHRSGSLTQSSDSTAQIAVTLTAEYNTNEEGHHPVELHRSRLHYAVTRSNAAWINSTDHGCPPGGCTSQPYAREYYERIRLYKSTSSEDLYVNLVTDAKVNHWTWIEGDDPPDAHNGLVPFDTDYLALGIWVSLQKSGTTLDYDNPTIGVFAGGGDPFNVSHVAALTGTATYRGEALGVYTHKPDTGNVSGGYAAGDVTLTADFGNGSATGTISGTISNLTRDNGFGLPGSLTLGAAPIGGSGQASFTGNTSGTISTVTMTGKWGGQFFSNPASDGTPADNYPGSVAGTFGATGSDAGETISLIGAFGGYKQ